MWNSMTWCEVGELLTNPETCDDVFWPGLNYFVRASCIPEDELIPQCVLSAGY